MPSTSSDSSSSKITKDSSKVSSSSTSGGAGSLVSLGRRLLSTSVTSTSSNRRRKPVTRTIKTRKGKNKNNHNNNHIHNTDIVLDIGSSIRNAITQGAPLFNEHNEKGCFEIYLSTAYSILSQETLFDVMKDDMAAAASSGTTTAAANTRHSQEESQQIIDLLTTAIANARAITTAVAETSKRDYSEGAWILRRAFDEILKITALKKQQQQSTVSTSTKSKKDSHQHGASITSTTSKLDSINLSSSSSSSSLPPPTEQEKEEYQSLGSALADLTATIAEIADIADRTYRLKTYKKCFVGKDTVTKLINAHVFMDRNSAVSQLQEMLQFGLIQHVTNDHEFQDADYYYRLSTVHEIHLKLKPFRNKTASLNGRSLIQYSALLGRYKQFHKHPSLGVIRLDYDYPPAPGDIDSPASYTYPVYYRAVPGLSFEMCQSGQMTTEVAKAFDDAVIWLTNHQDVSAITGDCGFMMWFTDRARQLCTAKKQPIVLSALMQLPTLVAACAPTDKILVLTANGKTLMPMLDVIKRTCGIDAQIEKQMIIIGCEDVPHFGEPVAKGLQVNVELAQPGIVGKALQAVQDHPETRMILMECTELPPYSDAVREATRLPVYDSITQSDFAMAGFLDNSAFGLNGWYEPWDGIQEDYVLGQNLNDEERLQCVWCANKEHEHSY